MGVSFGEEPQAWQVQPTEDPPPDSRTLYWRLSACSASAPRLAPSSTGLTSEYVEKTGLQEPLLLHGLSSSGSNLAYSDAVARLVKPHGTNPGAFHLDRLPDLLDIAGSTGATSARAAATGAGGSKPALVARREDKEVTTFDISRQCPGPRWSVRQWCLYWRDRHVPDPPPPFGVPGPEGKAPTGPAGTSLKQGVGTAAGQGRGGGATTGLGGLRPVSEAAAHMSAAGTSEGHAAGDMDDEADSAFVHQWVVDQFADQVAPRKGIREVNKRRLISLACLNILGTPLSTALPVPSALAAVDLLQQSGGAQTEGSSQFPYRHYLACHPAGAVINFNVNAGGATSWFHVIEGEVAFLLIPGTDANLAVYASWVTRRGRERGLVLPDACTGMTVAQVSKGQSLLIPGGWPYALVAPRDALLVGAQVLHPHNMRSQLLALEYEELLGVPTRLRYPAFKHIMWTLALGYAKALRQAAGLQKLQKQRMTSSKDNAGAGGGPTTTAVTLSQTMGRGGADRTQAASAAHAGGESDTEREGPTRGAVLGPGLAARGRPLPDEHGESPLVIRPAGDGGPPGSSRGGDKPQLKRLRRNTDAPRPSPPPFNGGSKVLAPVSELEDGADLPGAPPSAPADPNLPGLQGTTPLSIQLAGAPGQQQQGVVAAAAARDGAQPSDSVAMSAKHGLSTQGRPGLQSGLGAVLQRAPPKGVAGSELQASQLKQRHGKGGTAGRSQCARKAVARDDDFAWEHVDAPGEGCGMCGDEGSALEGGLGYTTRPQAGAAALAAGSMSDDDGSIGSTKKAPRQAAGRHRASKQKQQNKKKPGRRPTDMSESEGDFTPDVSDASMEGAVSDEDISPGTLDDSDDGSGSGKSAASGRRGATPQGQRGVRATALASGFARPGPGAAKKPGGVRPQPKLHARNKAPQALADWSEDESPAEEEEEEEQPASPAAAGARSGRHASAGGPAARSGAGRQRKRRALDPDFEYDAGLLGGEEEEGSEGEAGQRPQRGRAMVGPPPTSPRQLTHTHHHKQEAGVGQPGSKSVIKVTLKRPLHKEGSGDLVQGGLPSPGHAGAPGPLGELPPGAVPIPGLARAPPIKVKIRTHEGVQGAGLPSPSGGAVPPGPVSPSGAAGPGHTQVVPGATLHQPHAAHGIIPQTDGADDETEEHEVAATGQPVQAAGHQALTSLEAGNPTTLPRAQQATGQPVSALQVLQQPPVSQKPGCTQQPAPLPSSSSQPAAEATPDQHLQQAQPTGGDPLPAASQQGGPGAPASAGGGGGGEGQAAQMPPLPSGPSTTPGAETDATTPAATKAGAPGAKGGVSGLAPGAKRGAVRLSDAAPAATKAQGLVALGGNRNKVNQGAVSLLPSRRLGAAPGGGPAPHHSGPGAQQQQHTPQPPSQLRLAPPPLTPASAARPAPVTPSGRAAPHVTAPAATSTQPPSGLWPQQTPLSAAQPPQQEQQQQQPAAGAGVHQAAPAPPSSTPPNTTAQAALPAGGLGNGNVYGSALPGGTHPGAAAAPGEGHVAPGEKSESGVEVGMAGLPPLARVTIPPALTSMPSDGQPAVSSNPRSGAPSPRSAKAAAAAGAPGPDTTVSVPHPSSAKAGSILPSAAAQRPAGGAAAPAASGPAVSGSDMQNGGSHLRAPHPAAAPSATGAGHGASAAPPPLTLSFYEARDLPVLILTLRDWQAGGHAAWFDQLPPAIRDPLFLLDQLEEALAAVQEIAAHAPALDLAAAGAVDTAPSSNGTAGGVDAQVLAAPAAPASRMPSAEVPQGSGHTGPVPMSIDGAPPTIQGHERGQEVGREAGHHAGAALLSAGTLAALRAAAANPARPGHAHFAPSSTLPDAWRLPSAGPPGHSPAPSGLIMHAPDLVEETAETGPEVEGGLTPSVQQASKYLRGPGGARMPAGAAAGGAPVAGASAAGAQGGRGAGARAGGGSSQPPGKPLNSSKVAKMKKTLGL